MKKLLLLLLCVPLMFSCGDNKNDDKINKLEDRIDKIQKIIEEQAVEICLSDFFHKVENKEIKRVTFVNNKNYAEVELNNSNENPPQFTFKVSYETQLQYIMQKIDEIQLSQPDEDDLMIEFIEDNY